MLTGGSADPRNPPPVDEWHRYLLIKITGWTEAEIDATSTATIDWLLACHGLEVEIENERTAAANNQRGR